MADYAMDMDELDYNIRLRMMQNIAEETVTHRHSVRDPAVPVRQYGSFHPGTGVGGAGEHWTGMCFRFLPSLFTLRTHLTEKHGAAELPADLAVQDWGVTYDQLEPHYWYAEQMMGVSGKAGNLRGKLIEGGNIFESPRAHEYPTPPLKHSYASQLFEEATRKLGLSSLPDARREPERELHQSRRRLPRRLRLLRLLLALRLHDRSQGAAHQYAACRCCASTKAFNCEPEAGCAASCMKTGAPRESSIPTPMAKSSSNPRKPWFCVRSR